MRWPLVGLCVGIIAIAVLGRGCNSKPADQTTVNVPTPTAMESGSASVPKSDSGDPKRLAQLTPHFNIKADEFNHTVRAMHKAFRPTMNGNGTTLVAEVDNRTFNLCSQYVASDWIFHEKVTLKVGDEVLTASGPRKDEVRDGVIEEVCLDPEDGISFARLIRSAGDKPVRVRLEGKYYKDYTLRSTSQKAIAETIEYYDLKHN
jgi:hypothetical protein